MKMMLLALCLAALVVTVAFILPNVGGRFISGHTPTPGEVRSSVFNGLPRGLQ